MTSAEMTSGASDTRQKWRESLLRRTLQVRITSHTQKIQSSDWPNDVRYGVT